MHQIDASQRSRIKVLVCEDDELMRKALCEFVEDQGFMVVGAADDGFDAVALADRLEPDVILMDLRMPGLDGIGATRQIISARPAAKVILLTAYDDPTLHRSAIDSGAFCYLVKGCTPRLIEEVILRAWARDRPES